MATISERYLELISRLEKGEMYKAAQVASDAAMLGQMPAPEPGAPQGMPQEMPAPEMGFSDELRARADDPQVPPDVRSLMLENADRLELVNSPSMGAQQQMGGVAEAPPPEMMPPEEMAPDAGIPQEEQAPPKTASFGPDFDPDDFAEVKPLKTGLNYGTKNAGFEADPDRPPTYEGFRAFLAQYSNS